LGCGRGNMTFWDLILEEVDLSKNQTIGDLI
jgi:hypothetical protein